MASDDFDQAFARHVRQMGLVTEEQMTTAFQTQATSLKEGKTVSFSEALVRMGVITPAQKVTLEKKIRDQQAGIQQLGDYKLLRKLGEGGMGAVYLATDPAGKQVAVKVLPRNLGTTQDFVKRFRRESEAATRLKHPNIISAFFAGEDLGYHYFAMEYCDGTGLDKLLLSQKLLPVGQAITITTEMAKALKYVHDLGIIHRDIKPSNIMIDRDGRARLLDLGLSKNLVDSSLSFKTVTGAVLGTPHYISPEQAQGERDVDGRSDIYSLGATLYHLLTGRTPFEGATALEILTKHVNTRLPNPQDLREDLPDPVVHVLERMMAKEPSDRYRDCGELLTDLAESSQGRAPKTKVIAEALTTIARPARLATVKKRPISTRRTTARTESKKLPLILGAAAAAVLVVGLVLWSGSHDAGPDSAPNTAPAQGAKGSSPGSGELSWEKSVQDLPAEARIERVRERLQILNPGYDGSGTEHQIHQGRVTRLRLSHPSLRDLTPLRALTGLLELELTKTSVSDLSPLRDSKITHLVLESGKLTDLGPLRTLKELSILTLSGLSLRDLSALEGLDLARLMVKDCPGTDLSTLRRVRVRELACDFDAKRDTETLKSMPVLEQLNGVPVEEFWRKLRLSDAPAPGESASAGAPGPLSEALAKLKRLNPEWEGRETHTIDGGQVTELVIVALGITDLSPLGSLGSLRRLDVSGYWSKSEVKEYRSPLKDISALRGLKLRDLALHHTSVSDLSALQGMPLDSLELERTEVSDLTPLQGMPLRNLSISYTHVRNIRPLVGMPLATLRMEQIEVGDYSPLQGLPLQILDASLSPEKHHALVSSIKTLQHLNHAPVQEFLKASASPFPSADEAALWKNAVDLLSQIDSERDTVEGPWRKEGGLLYCDGGENAVLRIPYEAPQEYDFRIVFTRSLGHCATGQFLCHGNDSFWWAMGGYGNANAGFGMIAGKGSGDNPSNQPMVLRNGQRYVSVVEVRKDRVTAFVDGKKTSEWLPSMGALSIDLNWCVDVPGFLGLGNCESNTTFEVVQVREVTGHGRLRTSAATPPDAAFLKTVARQPAAEQARLVIEKLRDLNLGYAFGRIRYKIEGDHLTEFSCPAARLVDGWPIQALPFLKKLEIGEERIPGQTLDIGFLKGMKLQELCLLNARIADLAPLQSLPLSRLQLGDIGLRDLAALRGLKITALSIVGNPVLDFAPLRDLSVQKLDCDRNLAADYSVLKSVRTLKTVNDLPVADFIKGLKEGWTPLFDGRSADCLRSQQGWKLDRGALVNVPLPSGTPAQTRFEFENGDLLIRFEGKGWEALSFRVRQSDKGAQGILFDKGAVRALEGRPHELLFTCRGEAVAARLDGNPIALTETQPTRRGCLQFGSTGGLLRVMEIDFRAAP